MRNIILSAFPRNMRLPDPSTPNLKIDLLAEISQSPRILSEVGAALKAKMIKGDVDEYLKTRQQGSSFLTELKQKLLLPPSDAAQAGTQYNVPLINSLVLYVGMQVNEASLFEDLNESWEVLAEPIQTVMRRYGIPEPFEKLKELTRGRAVTRENIREFIEGLELPTEAKANLLELTPRTYVGAAVELARAVDMAVNSVNRLRYWTDTENNCK